MFVKVTLHLYLRQQSWPEVVYSAPFVVLWQDYSKVMDLLDETWDET